MRDNASVGPESTTDLAPPHDDAVPATFVFADLSGYTALTEAHGDEHAADTAAAFVREVRALMRRYDSQEIKTIGDALLLRVLDAADAVVLAQQIVAQQATRHRALHVRVGMHTGKAVCRDGDWFGAAVNLASRIADQAHAGEVLMSEATLAAAGSVLDGRVRARGRRRLKNVARPVELFVLDEGEETVAVGLPIDPVCRMTLDPDQAHARRVYRGVQYHLCSERCADAFAEAPHRYAERSRGAALRVSDEARDRAARAVARAYAKGRIDADELEQRTELAWVSRTRGDLRAVTHDLPRRRRGVPLWQAPIFPLVLLTRRARRRIRRRLRPR